MTICDSTVLKVSKITDTTIKIPVPPITKLVIPVIDERIAGKIAIIPKNNAPTLVIL